MNPKVDDPEIKVGQVYLYVNIHGTNIGKKKG